MPGGLGQNNLTGALFAIYRGLWYKTRRKYDGHSSDSIFSPLFLQNGILQEHLEVPICVLL